jgi:hypothetical protein
VGVADFQVADVQAARVLLLQRFQDFLLHRPAVGTVYRIEVEDVDDGAVRRRGGPGRAREQEEPAEKQDNDCGAEGISCRASLLSPTATP